MSELNCTNTYWNDKGKYQKEYAFLYYMLVPTEGIVSTYRGELLRCAFDIYFDIHKHMGNNFGLLLYERNTLSGFLSHQNIYAPNWLRESYICNCDVIYDDHTGQLEGCHCVTSPGITQRLIDELEEITNIIIEYCMRQESIAPR